MDIKRNNVLNAFKILKNEFAPEIKVNEIFNKFEIKISLLIVSLLITLYLNSTQSISFQFKTLILLLVYYIVYSKHYASLFYKYIINYDKNNDYKNDDIVKVWMIVLKNSNLINNFMIFFAIIAALTPLGLIVVNTYLLIFIFKDLIVKYIFNINNRFILIPLLDTQRFLDDEEYQDLINKQFKKVFGGV